MKISSLHDDVEFPWQSRQVAEYDQKSTLIQRLKQFGVTAAKLAEVGVTDWSQLTLGQYGQLISTAISQQYETIFASIYADWLAIPVADQRSTIQRVASLYQRWRLNLVPAELIICLEGADFVTEVADAERLYEQGIRSVMLQYGRPNRLADDFGLTLLGWQFVERLWELGMIVDLAHATPLPRRDILSMAAARGRGRQLAYTHGAIVEDLARDPQVGYKAEQRGLTMAEVRQIIQLGGIIGLGVTRPFFQNIEQLVTRIETICQVENGPQALGLGTDFGGVPPAWEWGIGEPAQTEQIAALLSTRCGYSDEIITQILRTNVTQWVTAALSSEH